MTNPITDEMWAARGPSIFSQGKLAKSLASSVENSAHMTASIDRKRAAGEVVMATPMVNRKPGRPKSAKQIAALREQI